MPGRERLARVRRTGFGQHLRQAAVARPVAALLALTALQAVVAISVVSLGPALPFGSELAQRLATTIVSAALAALLLQSLGLWREAGFIDPAVWRSPLAGVAASAMGLAPLLTGLAPLSMPEFGALVAGMAVNSFAEEVVFRGLERHPA